MVKTTVLVSVAIYFLVAVVSLLMALKCLSASKFLPFHERAAAKEWKDIDKSLQSVLIALVRISGLGFLTVSMILITIPLINIKRNDPVINLVAAIIPFIFCSGLFLFNYILYRQTNARTPWKGALVSMILLIAALLISIL